MDSLTARFTLEDKGVMALGAQCEEMPGNGKTKKNHEDGKSSYIIHLYYFYGETEDFLRGGGMF